MKIIDLTNEGREHLLLDITEEIEDQPFLDPSQLEHPGCTACAYFQPLFELGNVFGACLNPEAEMFARVMYFTETCDYLTQVAIHSAYERLYTVSNDDGMYPQADVGNLLGRSRRQLAERLLYKERQLRELQDD